MPARGLSERILVVDDEPAIVELIEFNLKRQGFEVHTAREILLQEIWGPNVFGDPEAAKLGQL